MSDIVIRADRLGKQYRIGRRERYKTVRDALMTPFRRGPSPPAETIWALQDVSFEIARGEVVGIIGRNGAGKSTLLKVLSRITEPTTGLVDLYGRTGSLLEVGTGFHPELTGRENVYLNGAILGMRRAEIAAKFDEIVAFAETEKFLDTPVKHYSSGMRIRLAFAVAAHLEPEILVVDEVLAVGDAAFQKKCLGKMGEVAKVGRTVLFVSHNMGVITQLCSRAIYMENGSIVKDAAPDEAVRTYLSASWISSTKWDRPLTLANTAQAQTLSVQLLPQQDTSPDVFDFRAPIRIQVRYQVTSPVRDLSILVRLTDTLGNILFTTWDTDTTDWRERIRPAGNYRLICTIPAALLKPGRYFISAGAYFPTVMVADFHEHILAFDLSAVGYNFNSTRKGLIAPLIPWTVGREDDQEAAPRGSHVS